MTEPNVTLRARSCAAVLDALGTTYGLTIAELSAKSGLEPSTVALALEQLRIDGCAERASWSNCWWATR